MASFFIWLRGLGPIGTTVANVLVFLTTNWVLVMGALLSIWAALSDWTVGVLQNPRIQVAVFVFIAILWTYIGITVLVDRRKPRIVRSHQDYRYGLTFEGIFPNWDPRGDAEAAFQFSLLLRNYSMGPIKYGIEHFDVRIGSRALPEWKNEGKTVYIPRGGAKMSSAVPFKNDDIKEFYGKEVTGTAKFSIAYGHPEETPVRRLKMIIELTLVFNTEKEPPTLGFNTNILEESDEPFSIR